MCGRDRSPWFCEREHAGFGVIGVGYDASEEAELALREAASLAKVLDSRLRVITVVPTLAPLPIQAPNLGQIQEAVRQSYRDALEKRVAQLSDDTSAEKVVRDGDPGATLADQGIELDLIVIGSRTYGPIRGVLAGSVSTQVMRNAPCPVLITPRGSEPSA